MDTVIPEAWQALLARERDVLVALAVGGPANGKRIHDRIPGSKSDTTTYKALNDLQERGLVTYEPQDNREGTYHPTDAGYDLLGRMNVVWDKALEAAHA